MCAPIVTLSTRREELIHPASEGHLIILFYKLFTTAAGWLQPTALWGCDCRGSAEESRPQINSAIYGPSPSYCCLRDGKYCSLSRITGCCNAPMVCFMVGHKCSQGEAARLWLISTPEESRSVTNTRPQWRAVWWMLPPVRERHWEERGVWWGGWGTLLYTTAETSPPWHKMKGLHCCGLHCSMTLHHLTGKWRRDLAVAAIYQRPTWHLAFPRHQSSLKKWHMSGGREGGEVDVRSTTSERILSYRGALNPKLLPFCNH